MLARVRKKPTLSTNLLEGKKENKGGEEIVRGDFWQNNFDLRIEEKKAVNNKKKAR